MAGEAKQVMPSSYVSYTWNRRRPRDIRTGRGFPIWRNVIRTMQKGQSCKQPFNELVKTMAKSRSSCKMVCFPHSLPVLELMYNGMLSTIETQLERWDGRTVKR